MPWKKITDMKLSGSRLHICDMRPGPSEDGILVELENGIYTIEVLLTHSFDQRDVVEK